MPPAAGALARAERARPLLAAVAAAAAVAFLLGFPPGAAAQSLQAQRWYQIDTPHFRVHGHASVAALLPTVATYAERAHDALVPLFGAPAGRTSIVVTDPFDAANGVASVVPRRVVQVYAYPPDTLSTLGHHDDWLWNLIVHEYTHILHMDSMGRAFAWLNLPFGRRWAPNQALPRWLIEGLATWQESAHSGTGRTRSNLFRMQLRAAALAGTEPPLGTLSGYPGDWPGAGFWYLSGAFFVDAIARWHGADAWGRFVRSYGRRAVPYGINVTAREAFGEDFPSMYARFVATERVAAAAFVANRSLQALTTSVPVSTTGFRTVESAWDDESGTLAWIEAGGDRPPSLVWRAPGRSGRIHGFDGDGVALLPGGAAAITVESFIAAQGVTRNDLVEVDLDTGHGRRLTRGARASEPAVSEDGRLVAYVAAADGRSDLWLLDRATLRARCVARAGEWSLFGTPSFVDERTLVASLHRPGLGRDLVLVDVESGQVRPLVEGRGEAIGPAAVHGGQWVVFSDDRDGVFSLYAVEIASRSVFALTRPLSGHFAPTVQRPAPDDLTIHAAEYSERGYDVVTVAVRWPPTGDAVATDPHVPRSRPWASELEPRWAMRRHRDLHALIPYRWFPIVSVAAGDGLVGASFAAADVTGRHDYTALISWSLGARTPVFAVSAQTSALPLRLFASASRVVEARDESLVAGSGFVPFDEVLWSASVATAAVLDARGGSHTLSLEWSLLRTGFLRVPELRHAPEDVEPTLLSFPRLDSLGFGWSWSSTRASARAISTQSGFAASVGARVRGPFTGAEVDSAELGMSLRAYVTMPYHDHHAVAVRLAGGVSQARRIGRRLYALGGPAPQDALQAMASSLPSGTTHVRGFEPAARVGNRYALATAEYRLALFRWHAGYATLPVVFERLALALFGDAGYAGSQVVRTSDLIGGVGAELRLETTISYFRGASLRLGLARGIGRDAITDVYLLYGWWF